IINHILRHISYSFYYYRYIIVVDILALFLHDALPISDIFIKISIGIIQLTELKFFQSAGVNRGIYPSEITGTSMSLRDNPEGFALEAKVIMKIHQTARRNRIGEIYRTQPLVIP